MVAVLLFTAAPATAFVFNDPTVRQIAPETVPFDWSTQKCNEQRHPGPAARAYREPHGTIDLIPRHALTLCAEARRQPDHARQRLQPDRHDLRRQRRPGDVRRPEWLGSRRRHDGGTTVYGLIHPSTRVRARFARLLHPQPASHARTSRSAGTTCSRWPAPPTGARPSRTPPRRRTMSLARPYRYARGTARSASSSRATSCAARTAATTCSCT